MPHADRPWNIFPCARQDARAARGGLPSPTRDWTENRADSRRFADGLEVATQDCMSMTISFIGEANSREDRTISAADLIHELTNPFHQWVETTLEDRVESAQFLREIEIASRN